MMNDENLSPTLIYEMIAELDFRKYFHFGGMKATRELIRLLPLDESRTILDVGSANGRTACYLARTFGCHVTGIDVLPEMVRRANQRAQRERVENLVQFRAGDAQAIPLEDDQFDIVLSEFVTGLVVDKEKALSEYCRVAKPGGTIGLNEGTLIRPSPPPGLAEFMRHQVGFQGEVLSPEGWHNLLTDAGVRSLKIETHKVDTLRNPRDDIADLLRTWPRLLKMIVRNPQFRKFLKISLTLPDVFLEYVGYGLFVGVNGFTSTRAKVEAHDADRITAS